MVQLFQSPPQQKIDPIIPQDRPVYRVLNEKGFYGPDDALHPEGEIIVLYDVPNEDMEPMNELARAAFEKYIDSLEESARVVAEKNGRFFAGRPRTKEEMIANASADARISQTTANPNGVKIMGAKLDSRRRIGRVGPEAASEMSGSNEERAKKIQKLA